MQTFLPYSDFARSAASLSDGKGGHLSNQRNEALIILRSCLTPLGGWPNHSVTRMWRGYEGYLVMYITCLQLECVKRGIAGTSAYDRTVELNDQFKITKKRPDRPDWLGNRSFHVSHRSNLIRKQPKHYGPQFPNVSNDLPYVWPAEGIL